MLLPEQASAPELRATVNGTPVQPAIHHRQRGATEDAWALIELPAGRSDVEILVSGNSSGLIGAWLVATYTLPVTSTLNSTIGTELYPVFAADQGRRVATLLQPTAYTLPLPALPQDARVSLGDLKMRCLSAKVGFFHVGWNTSCWDEQPGLRIGQTTYEKGLGVHAPSRLVFDIDCAFSTFTADIGMHGVPPERKAKDAIAGSSVFIVEGDGKTLYTSSLLKENDAPQHVEISVKGVKRLTLRTTDGGDSNFDDLGAWGNAVVSR